MASDFDPQRARSKRPCPLWADAFLRDTQHLQADEIGSYMLILMAMWTRPSCDLPNNPARLARVARVSARLWNSRIGAVIMGFLEVEDGAVVSPRLRKEATYVERQVTQQSNRRTGLNSDKPLKSNYVDQSTDETTDVSGVHPSYNPTTYIRDGDDAGASEDDLTFREKVVVAAGCDRSGLNAKGQMVGSFADFSLFEKARSDLKISEQDALSIIEEVAKRKRDGPPSSLKYFQDAMSRYAGARDSPTVAASTSGQGGGPAHYAKPDLKKIIESMPEYKNG